MHHSAEKVQKRADTEAGFRDCGLHGSIHHVFRYRFAAARKSGIRTGVDQTVAAVGQGIVPHSVRAFSQHAQRLGQKHQQGRFGFQMTVWANGSRNDTLEIRSIQFSTRDSINECKKTILDRLLHMRFQTA
jgi:hypothetical protein